MEYNVFKAQMKEISDQCQDIGPNEFYSVDDEDFLEKLSGTIGNHHGARASEIKDR